MAGSEGKKRKRVVDGGSEGTSKTQRVQGDVKVVQVEQEGLHPVLLTTPGLTTPSISFNAYAKAKSSKAAGKTIQPHTHELLLHSTQHARVDYTAITSTSDQKLAHYTGVFDPATNTLQLIPSHHLTLKAIPRKPNAELEARSSQSRKNYISQREALGREFGTKKAQKFIASRTINAITNSPSKNGKGKATDVQEAILTTIADAGASQPKREEVEHDLLASKPIPTPNLDAEHVEDVYRFNTLIPPAEARLIPVQDWQNATRSGEAIMFNHRFPAHRVEAIGKGDNTDQLKAIRYMTLLLEFQDALTGSGGKGGKKVPKQEVMTQKFANWPPELVTGVRRRFTAEGGTTLGKWELERLWCHICCLGLFVSPGWKMETTDLRLDLKMENTQLGQYFSELGAKVARPTEKERESYGLKSKAEASVSRVARLKLPLEFPKARVGRRR
ncbi:hypothetical protein LTR62_005268 [Meristemomyces frigidus]|uniref:RNA polymerase I associated factor, A49-like protein n=1 Tax=Meristemomyces frigidus TaxID=1508187 RepID=A0AAN7TPZ8_9PEZI|nr:hypothetical protein LTR62_005268 [Meristemomyces frigidus]